MDRMTIPVMRPRLPDADRLRPYLHRIDQNRWYTNFGPLALELEQRLAQHWQLPPGTTLSVSNGTNGLVIALWAVGATTGGLCLMPSWTFIATAHAAAQAGLTPFLADVDAASGALTPAQAEAALAQAPGPVAAVIAVCPFGAPVDWTGWEAFRHRTGVPVVIDAAAAFDTLVPTALPTVVSLHATKALAAAEGGVLVCRDPEVVNRARAHANFGFQGGRVAEVLATNAKMSEYHAAVAQAALDAWPETRTAWTRTLTLLRQACAGQAHCQWPDALGRDYVSSSPAVSVADADAVAITLARHGIEARRWWQGGIASHPAFASCPALPLGNTERLAATTLVLPCWTDLDETVAQRIGQALADHGA